MDLEVSSSPLPIEQLGPLIKNRRGNRGLRQVAAEINVSAATLSRVESGKRPDLESSRKICAWLGVVMMLAPELRILQDLDSPERDKVLVPLTVKQLRTLLRVGVVSRHEEPEDWLELHNLLTLVEGKLGVSYSRSK